MYWLLTIEGRPAEDEVRSIIREIGLHLEGEAFPIEVDGNTVIEIEGPEDLPKKCTTSRKIVAVHPSSEMALY